MIPPFCSRVSFFLSLDPALRPRFSVAPFDPRAPPLLFVVVSLLTKPKPLSLPRLTTDFILSRYNAWRKETKQRPQIWESPLRIDVRSSFFTSLISRRRRDVGSNMVPSIRYREFGTRLPMMRGDYVTRPHLTSTVLSSSIESRVSASSHFNYHHA